MSLVRISVTRFEFEWNDEILSASFIMAGNLHSCVDVPFKAVHRRPNVLFNLEQFADA